MVRTPTGPFDTRRTGCFGCVRRTPADGSCGIGTYPCQHFGIDLFATSPQVFAPERGVVVDVADGQSAPFRGYGPGIVLMKGASGFFHLLAHLNFGMITVKPGQQVAEGQLLGTFDTRIGHTHWEVRRQRTGPSTTNTIDPNAWLRDQLALQQSSPPVPPTSSGGAKFLAGFAVVGGLVGLSWLAVRAAKNAGHML